MGINLEKAIEKMYDLQRKGTKYSMNYSRTGADGTADCSGAVYASVCAGGGSNFGYVPSTETLHAYLLQNGFELVTENQPWQAKRGDITIWGRKGQSAGAGGHTGIWVDGNNWIECTAWKNGVVVSDHDQRWIANGRPYYYTYRLKGGTTNQTPTPQKPSESGAWIPENGTFTSNTAINLRAEANTAGKVISLMSAGSKIKYDAYKIDSNGYVWIRQPRSGGYGYLATGESRNGERINYWGAFY